MTTCSSGDHSENQQSCLEITQPEITSDARLVSSRSVCRALVFSSHSLSPSSRLSVELSSSLLAFFPFLSDDDKDHDDLTKDWRLLSLSAELLYSLLALSPLLPPSGRLSAELSSSSLACSPFLSPTTTMTTTIILRTGQSVLYPDPLGPVCVILLHHAINFAGFTNTQDHEYWGPSPH